VGTYTFLKNTDTSFGAIYVWAKKLITDLNRGAGGNAVMPSGATSMWLGDTAPNGWLLCDGTLYLITDYPDLFNQIHYTYGGAGSQFQVPDLRNRILMGAGTLVGLNAVAGSDRATLGIDQLPAHTHVVDDPEHTHAFEAAPHTHVVHDPKHVHVLYDPGHHHAGGVGSTGTASAAGATGPTTPADTADAPTGILMLPELTGITNENTVVTGTNASSATGIANEETGGGQAFSVLNPVFGVNVIIKV
jgi:microcystin-dependent protein